jgi:AraC-like DNA-binding protein
MNDVVVMNVNKEINSIFKRMNKLLEQPYSQDTKCSMMTSALFILLHEISSNISPTMAVPTVNTIIPKAIHYISAHISDIISVDNIANELNVSASTLAHTFKKEMQISIHQYILKKRLSACRAAILGGGKINDCYLLYGFKDYSSFYRAFKKEYGLSPSEYKEFSSRQMK